MCFELPFTNECYTVVYMSCGVIAHMIDYEDLSSALSDAIYWKHHTKVWVSEIIICKNYVIIAVLTGREI